MIFLTVGTQFPFDRLVRAVDEAAASGLVRDEIFAQVGKRGYRPRRMRWVETLDRDQLLEKVACARQLVGHAGTGTILLALAAGKPLLVMPRLRRCGEIVNDHQVATARKFSSLGHVLAADDENEIPAKLVELATFVPKPRVVDPAPLVARVRRFLTEVEE